MSEDKTNENQPTSTPIPEQPVVPTFPEDRIEKGEKPSDDDLKKG